MNPIQTAYWLQGVYTGGEHWGWTTGAPTWDDYSGYKALAHDSSMPVEVQLDARIHADEAYRVLGGPRDSTTHDHYTGSVYNAQYPQ